MRLGFEVGQASPRSKKDFVETMFLHQRFYSSMKIAIFGCATALVFCGCDGNGVDISRPKDDMNSISSVVIMYNINNGHYPSSAQGLMALVARPTGDPQPMNWTQLSDKVPLDPWGQEYRYESGEDVEGKKQTYQFRIISTGKDLQLGTEDDIVHEEPLTKGS
jgi:general secretion pathway protein G